MFGNNAPDGAEILALLGMRPTTKHAPTLARPKIKFAKPRFVPTGSISAPDPSIRNSIQQTLAGVLSKAIDERQAHRLASRAMAPLTDATPLGNVTGAEEGGKQFYRGLTRGDARTAGLGALSFGLSVLPVPGGVKKAARKTGLFGSLMKDETGAIRAWHGSPHDFDRFDISKIGTGEGAQAYGHGLYFAENPEVARQYREELTRNQAVSGGFNRSFVSGDREISRQSPDYKIAELANLAQTYPDDILKDYGSVDAWFKSNAGAAGMNPRAAKRRFDELMASPVELRKHRGRLYEVNINAEPEDFLDWDVSLKHQPRNVQQAYKKLGVTDERVEEIFAPETVPLWKDPSGNAIYRVAPFHGRDPLQTTREERNAALLQAGIPGIRYLDQGSRSAADGTRNYVVFDDSLIDILNKF